MLDRTGPERTEPDWTGPNRTGPDRTGPERTGPDRTGPDQTGPDRVFLSAFMSVHLYLSLSIDPAWLSCLSVFNLKRTIIQNIQN